MRGCGKPGCSYFLECSRLRANVGLGTLLIRKGPMEGPRMFWNVLEREKEGELSGRRPSAPPWGSHSGFEYSEDPLIEDSRTRGV